MSDSPPTEPGSTPPRPGPYARIALLGARHPWWVILGIVVLTAIAGVIGLPPSVDNDILSMMPADEPVVEASRHLAENGGVELLTIGLVDEDAESGTSERLTAYAEELVAALDAMEDVDFVFHKVDPDLAFKLGLYQVDPKDLKELTTRLRGAVALGPALNPVVAGRLLDMGETTDRLAKARDVSLVDEDSRTARIVVRPIKTAQDKKFAQAFYTDLEELLAAHPPPDPAVRIAWIGGAHRHSVEDVRTLQKDLGWTTGLAAVFVLAIVALAFRDLRATLIVFVPIVIANIWTLGLMALVAGSLNTFTSAGVAILIGLGIDFAVHLFGRYREIRAGGATQEEALIAAWEKSGPPCTTAGLTSAAGFLALVAATFRGFSQIGIMLAFGLLMCLAVMMVLLPAMIRLLEPNPGRPLPGAGLQSGRESSNSYRLAPTGLMVAVIVTGVAGAIALPQLNFDYDMSTFRAEGSGYDELSDVERELAESSFAPLVVTYPTADALRDGQAELIASRDRGELPFVSQIVSVQNLLPTDATDRQIVLQQLAAVMRSPNIRYVHASPARPIVEALMPLRELDLSKPLSAADLPNGLVEMAGGGTDEHRLLVFPDGNIWDMRNALEMLEGVQGVVGTLPVAGPVGVQGLAYKYTSRDMPIVGGLALALVTLLTFIDLRRPLFTLGAMGALLAGLVWAGVALRSLGISLSIVNVIGVPILLGIGIDVVIHLLHRLREEGPGGVRRAWLTTGVSAAVSTGTTVASFAALLLASSRGIRSLGELVVVGLTTITLVGALFLPLAWAAGWRMSGQAPGQKEPETGAGR